MAENDDKTPPQSNVIKLPGKSARNKAQPFRRLKGLSCFPGIHQRITEGIPLKEIIRWIQVEQKEATDLSYTRLSGMLSKYRQSLPKMEMVGKILSPALIEIAEKARQQLDEVAEMGELFHEQKERIGLGRELEKKLKMPLPATKEEMRLAKDILQASAELKMDLGLNKRHIGQVSIHEEISAEITAKFGNPAVEKVLNNPTSRHKVLSLAERLLLASKKHEQVIEGVLVSSEPAAEVTTAAVEPATPSETKEPDDTVKP